MIRPGPSSAQTVMWKPSSLFHFTHSTLWSLDPFTQTDFKQTENTKSHISDGLSAKKLTEPLYKECWSSACSHCSLINMSHHCKSRFPVFYQVHQILHMPFINCAAYTKQNTSCKIKTSLAVNLCYLIKNFWSGTICFGSNPWRINIHTQAPWLPTKSSDWFQRELCMCIQGQSLVQTMYQREKLLQTLHSPTT